MRLATSVYLIYLILVVCIVSLVRCDTIISTDTNWTSDQVVEGDLIVNKNVFLTIQSGVRVSLEKGKSVLVSGILKVLGTSDRPVVFNTTTGERWGKMYFNEDCTPSIVTTEGEYDGQTILRNVRLLNADLDYAIEFQNAPVPDRNRKFYLEGIGIENSGGIRGIDVLLYIRNSKLISAMNSYEQAVSLLSTHSLSRGVSYLSIRDTEISNYQKGVSVDDCGPGPKSELININFKNILSGNAVHSTCNVTIQKSKFDGSKVSFSVPSGDIEIVNNEFYNCEEDTINLMQTLPQNFVIQNNLFRNCDIGRGQLIQSPSWRFSYKVILKGNKFEKIQSNFKSGKLMVLKDGIGGVEIIDNTFSDIEMHDESSLFLVEGPMNVRIWKNEFNIPKTRYAFKVISLFDNYPVLDARYNRWLDSSTALDIRQKAYDFMIDTNLSYTSFFPAFLSNSSEPVYFESQDYRVKTGNVEWEREVIVTYGNMVVEVGSTLKIKPGATIKLGDANSIVILGEIQARGTEKDRITFKSVNPNGFWHTLFIAPSFSASVVDSRNEYISGSILEYVDFENNNKAVFPTIDATIDSKLLLKDISVTMSGWTGSMPCINVRSPSSSPDLELIVQKSKFFGCYSGLQVFGDSKTTVRITESTFMNNMVGVECTKSACRLSKNFFTENYVGLSGRNLEIDSNDFISNSELALSGADRMILRNTRFKDNGVDMEIATKDKSSRYIWEGNSFESPRNHFFTTFERDFPWSFEIKKNLFQNGRCSPRSPTVMHLLATEFDFIENVVADCVCSMGDVVRIQATERADFQFNIFRDNIGQEVPPRPEPAILLTDADKLVFSYNVFTGANNASFLFYREGQSVAPLDLSRNYWEGLRGTDSILPYVGSDTEVEAVVTPYFISEDVRDPDNLECDHGYVVNEGSLVCKKPRFHPRDHDGRLMIVLITFLWVGASIVIASFVVLVALFIRRRIREHSRSQESYRVQKDQELVATEPATIMTPSSP